MKRLALLLAAVGGLFTFTQAHALLGFTLGAHIGTIDFDNNAIDGDAVVGANLGYEVFDLLVFDVALDLEINRSLDDFDVAGLDADYESTGLFLTGKTAGPLYAIGRFGLIDAELGGSSDDGTVISVGAGFSLGTQIEVTLNSISFDDADDAQQINLRIGF